VEKEVLVLIPLEQRHKELLEQSAKQALFTYSTYKDVSIDAVQKANIIIGNPPAHMLKDSANLELLQLNTAGTGVYVDNGVLPKNVILTNATGAYGLAISEHMIGIVLELFKKLHLYRDSQKKHAWIDEGSVKSIYGSTTLVVGLGDIGSEFAKRMKALGSYTIGIKRTLTQKPDYMDELYLIDQLDKLLPKADIVALSLPATQQTYKLFSKDKLAKMKPGSILINVGRGTSVDTDALCDVLESGHLLGAALDVTDPEPLPENHRIWDIKNAIITPHISGQYHLQETHERIVKISVHNLKAFIEGNELQNIVDFSTGYRKS
jgi:phosphoglycerate dehydrogenase-like enzyme